MPPRATTFLPAQLSTHRVRSHTVCTILPANLVSVTFDKPAGIDIRFHTVPAKSAVDVVEVVVSIARFLID